MKSNLVSSTHSWLQLQFLHPVTLRSCPDSPQMKQTLSSPKYFLLMVLYHSNTIQTKTDRNSQELSQGWMMTVIAAKHMTQKSANVIRNPSLCAKNVHKWKEFRGTGGAGHMTLGVG